MLNRRGFLQVAAVGGAALAVSTTEAISTGPFRRRQRRQLGEPSVPSAAWRHGIPRDARPLSPVAGPNGKGNPVGGGGGYQVQVITTDQNASGWAMSSAKPDVAQKLVGSRLDELFDLPPARRTWCRRNWIGRFTILSGTSCRSPSTNCSADADRARWPCTPGRSIWKT